VRNEWGRFLALMKGDRSRLLIPCYRDMDPYDLPEEMSMLQSLDMGKIGFIQDLVRGVKKIVDAGKKPDAAPVAAAPVAAAPVAFAAPATGGLASVEPLLKRAAMFLEEGDFAQAAQYADRVLDTDPENAQAYVIKFCAGMNVRRARDLANATSPLSENANYRNAIRFADEVLRKDLQWYEQQVRQTIEDNIRFAEEERRRIAEEEQRRIAEEKRRMLVHGLNNWRSIHVQFVPLTVMIPFVILGTIQAPNASGVHVFYWICFCASLTVAFVSRFYAKKFKESLDSFSEKARAQLDEVERMRLAELEWMRWVPVGGNDTVNLLINGLLKWQTVRGLCIPLTVFSAVATLLKTPLYMPLPLHLFFWFCLCVSLTASVFLVLKMVKFKKAIAERPEVDRMWLTEANRDNGEFVLLQSTRAMCIALALLVSGVSLWSAFLLVGAYFAMRLVTKKYGILMKRKNVAYSAPDASYAADGVPDATHTAPDAYGSIVSEIASVVQAEHNAPRLSKPCATCGAPLADSVKACTSCGTRAD
jgi:tetratricopeptide (TPR) repeat protein